MDEMRFREATPDEITVFSTDAKISTDDFPYAFTPRTYGVGWLHVSTYLNDRFGLPQFNRPRGCHPAWILAEFEPGQGKDWRVVLFLRTEKDAFAFKMRWC